jgi:hypothetical protein
MIVIELILLDYSSAQGCYIPTINLIQNNAIVPNASKMLAL